MSPAQELQRRALTHEIIEAAKKSHKSDGALPFVRHLEICAAGRLKGESGWSFQVSCGRGGVWGLELAPANETPEIDEDGVLL